MESETQAGEEAGPKQARKPDPSRRGSRTQAGAGEAGEEAGPTGQATTYSDLKATIYQCLAK